MFNKFQLEIGEQKIILGLTKILNCKQHVNISIHKTNLKFMLVTDQILPASEFQHFIELLLLSQQLRFLKLGSHIQSVQADHYSV